MICTNCGQENDDDQRFCTRCERKLQSSFTIPDPYAVGEGEGVHITRLKFETTGLSKLALLRYVEAWGYALAVLIMALWCGRNGIYWPLYMLVPGLALVMWRRKI